MVHVYRLPKSSAVVWIYIRILKPFSLFRSISPCNQTFDQYFFLHNSLYNTKAFQSDSAHSEILGEISIKLHILQLIFPNLIIGLMQDELILKWANKAYFIRFLTNQLLSIPGIRYFLIFNERFWRITELNEKKHTTQKSIIFSNYFFAKLRSKMKKVVP